MQIDKNTRMFKLFAWSIRLLIALNDGEPLRKDYLSEGTDLCHFMRTILVTMPMVIVLQALAVIMPVMALIVMPYYWFETKGVVFSVSTIAVVFLFILLLMFIKDLGEKSGTKSPTEPTLAKLVVTYIKAKKSRICPLIRWKESK